jgi:hypothetical protein
MPNFIGPLPEAKSVAISLSHAPELSIWPRGLGEGALIRPALGSASTISDGGERSLLYVYARSLEKLQLTIAIQGAFDMIGRQAAAGLGMDTSTVSEEEAGEERA